MSVELNHTIVASKDKRATARFFADILGLEVSPDFGPFVPVETANGVTLDFADATEVPSQHYAFLVSEEEFDEIFARVKDSGTGYWADPHHRQPGESNHLYGGRGVYFEDPNGHNLEIITQPYA
jgi:catechol 2,3-dioxygenase-like lactoylglutathione lyase family enzyme